MTDFKFPNNTQRVSIVGMTGSGKTRFAAWLLSQYNFRQQPYVIIDVKGDDLLQRIDRAIEIDHKTVPKAPGLYYMNPHPDQVDEMETWLTKVWERGRTGLYFDEGYVFPNSKALNRILTQGRSLRIPAMILTQRPVWCSRFVFTQADFIVGFYVNDERDWEPLRALTPKNAVWDFNNELPPYCARWYDVARRYSTVLRPVPGDEYILDRFDAALRRPIRGV